MNISHPINHQLAKSFYLVSFTDVDYNECRAFVVVACSKDEADRLTPNKDVNYHIGQILGYNCPEFDYEAVSWYRDTCGHRKSIERLEEAGADLPWGYVPYSSYKRR
jgi:hypothetical protein